jgi:hypothetical protein
MNSKELEKKLLENGFLNNGKPYTRRYLDYILAGERRPSPELAAAISAVTNGQKTIAELLFPNGLPPEARICASAS